MERCYNLEAEQQLLACVLRNGPEMALFSDTLTAEDFGDQRHKLIYSAAEAVQKNGYAPSYVTIMEELEKHQQLESVGGLSYLMLLDSSFVTEAQLRSNAAILKEYAAKRELNRLALRLQCRSRDVGVSSEELMAECQETLKALESRQRVKLKSKSELLWDCHMELEEALTQPDAARGLTTGFKSLDEKLQGLRKGSFIVLGARPSMGKTVMALNIARAASRNAGRELKRVLFVSLEMQDIQLVNRVLCAMTGIEGRKINEARLLTENEREALYFTKNVYFEEGLEIIEEHSCSLAGLRQLCYTLRHEQGLDMVVIDYLGLMQGDYRQDKYTQISEISKGLKSLALELEIPILALSQLNRGVESRVNKEPLMSDLRDSGTIEQDADVVLLLYRDDFYNPYNCKEPNIAKVIISKNRHGATGTVKLFFDKRHYRFLEVC